MKTKFTAFFTIVMLLCLFAPVSVFAGTINYAYDNNGRLTGADYGAGKSIAYTYDSNGNLLTRKVDVSAPQYVSDDGTCGGKSPCYPSIQDAIDNAATGSVILVKQGTYEESLSLESDKTLTIKGGYNEEYDQPTANTTFIQPSGPTTIKASSGSLKFQMINVK